MKEKQLMDTSGNYIQNQFVSYKIASKLKELGFDEQCLAVYRDRWNDFGITLISQSIEIKGSQSMKLYDISNNEMICLAPLWQQIIDWFREKYELYIVITVNPYSEVDNVNGYKIYDGNTDIKCISNQETQSWSYYKAREQAILKCIEFVPFKN